MDGTTDVSTATAVQAPPDRRGSAYGLIWRTPFYRAAMLSLFLAGIGVSAANPQLTLYLVNELGASLAVAGLFYLTSVAAPVVGLVVGRLSDRLPDRLTLLYVCAAVG